MDHSEYETEEAMLIRILRVQNEIKLLKQQRDELMEELRVQDEVLCKIFQKD